MLHLVPSFISYNARSSAVEEKPRDAPYYLIDVSSLLLTKRTGSNDMQWTGWSWFSGSTKCKKSL